MDHVNEKDIEKYKSIYNYVAYEKDAGETSKSFAYLDGSISLFIGPEGGFEESEIKQLNDMGFINVSLGKRILRTETAAAYGLSVISFLLEK